jgi:hypothetical protein
MSRSIGKKYRTHGNYKGLKALSNKRVRRLSNLPDGTYYKRAAMSEYDLNDNGRALPIPNDDAYWRAKLARK